MSNHHPEQEGDDTETWMPHLEQPPLPPHGPGDTIALVLFLLALAWLYFFR